MDGNLTGYSCGYSISIGTSIEPIGLLFPEMWCIDRVVFIWGERMKKKSSIFFKLFSHIFLFFLVLDLEAQHVLAQLYSLPIGQEQSAQGAPSPRL